MNSASLIYVQEITNFLDTVVVKFEPFVTVFNEKLEYSHIPGYDEYDLKTAPYYRILAGDTEYATEELYGYSPHLKSEILLTRENVIAYPDIVTFYRNYNNLKVLLNRYPRDQFIIRRVLNPVVDIDAAIAAKNLTILPTQYEDQFLDQYEHDSLVLFLQDILWRIDYRWYISPFEFEDQYSLAFWSMLWCVLPYILLTKRVLNIKTSYVHPYHIWEYLTSLGFGAYKGYLTHDQELFLYRNALYLKFNAGKKFLLTILENVFLSPLMYSLSQKTIIAHTQGRENTHDKFPDIVPSIGNAEAYLSSTSFDSFLQDIYAGGHDNIDTDTYRNSVTKLFSKAPTNKLATKFLEFDRNIDMSEMMLLLRFILDSTVYLNSKNKLMFGVDIVSPITQNIIRLNNTTDALNLLYYCIYKQDNPVNTFTNYTITTAIIHDKAPVIQKYVNVNMVDYFIKSYVDLDEIVTPLPYISDDVYTPAELSTNLGVQYNWLFAMINKLKSLSESVEHEAHVAVFKTLVPERQVINIEQTYDTYAEYFNKYQSAFEEVNRITDDSQYGEFMYAIISAICPLEYGFTALVRDDLIISVLIQKIKELFMYMVSYNIAFLNKTFEQSNIFELPKLTLHLDMGVNPDPDKLVYTEFINSLFSFSPDGSNTTDYRVNLTSVGNDTVDTYLEGDVGCKNEQTSIMINVQPGTQEGGMTDTNTIDVIYVTDCGLDIIFENTI